LTGQENFLRQPGRNWQTHPGSAGVPAGEWLDLAAENATAPQELTTRLIGFVGVPQPRFTTRRINTACGCNVCAGGLVEGDAAGCWSMGWRRTKRRCKALGLSGQVVEHLRGRAARFPETIDLVKKQKTRQVRKTADDLVFVGKLNLQWNRAGRGTRIAIDCRKN